MFENVAEIMQRIASQFPHVDVAASIVDIECTHVLLDNYKSTSLQTSESIMLVSQLQLFLDILHFALSWLGSSREEKRREDQKMVRSNHQDLSNQISHDISFRQNR